MILRSRGAKAPLLSVDLMPARVALNLRESGAVFPCKWCSVAEIYNKFKMLADYGGAVLAGRETRFAFEFVTWDWDFNRKGVNHGHYYQDSLDTAAEDFAVRSGLVDRNRIFTPEQLEEIYRCCEDTLCDAYELDEKQRKTIESVQEQIRYAIPDIVEQIHEHDRQAYEQEHGQKFEQTM